MFKGGREMEGLRRLFW